MAHLENMETESYDIIGIMIWKKASENVLELIGRYCNISKISCLRILYKRIK